MAVVVSGFPRWIRRNPDHECRQRRIPFPFTAEPDTRSEAPVGEECSWSAPASSAIADQERHDDSRGRGAGAGVR